MLKKITCLVILIAFTFSACKKDHDDKLPPEITTIEPTAVGATTAMAGGKGIISVSPILEKGICWSESTPTIADSKTSDGSGNPGFESKITGLKPGKYYYVRAYATNKHGTGYGTQCSFQTKELPELKTYYPLTLETNSATCVGEITRASVARAESVGLCWGTLHNPTMNDNYVIKPYQTTFGTYTLPVTGFKLNTTYYIRAFATTSLGTGYGNEIKITTHNSTVTDIDGNIYNTVKIGTQEWMVENLMVTRFRNGNAITPVNDFPHWISIQPVYSQMPYINQTFHNLEPMRFYNWYAANDDRNIAPAGWHVSTETDWQKLTKYLGTDSAAYKMKLPNSEYWYLQNSSNESGFTALGTGDIGSGSFFNNIQNKCTFWLKNSSPRAASMNGAQPYVNITNTNAATMGYSIRCVKD